MVVHPFLFPNEAGHFERGERLEKFSARRLLPPQRPVSARYFFGSSLDNHQSNLPSRSGGDLRYQSHHCATLYGYELVHHFLFSIPTT